MIQEEGFPGRQLQRHSRATITTQIHKDRSRLAGTEIFWFSNDGGGAIVNISISVDFKDCNIKQSD
jgi:hypothetical protein